MYVVISVTDGVNTYRLYNNGTYARGVGPNGVPAPYTWGTANANRYLVIPYTGGAQASFTIKIDPPITSFTISLCEYAIGGDSIDKYCYMTNGSAVLKNIDASDLVVGMTAKGTDVPNGTTISSISSVTNSSGQKFYTVTLSANCTGTNTAAFVRFYDSSDIIASGDENLIAVAL